MVLLSTYLRIHLLKTNLFQNIQLPNGGHVEIKSIGPIKLHNDIILDDVLHVPNFKMNLLSIRQLTPALGCNVIFYLDFCVMLNLTTKKTIGLGNQSNGLYYLTRNPKPCAQGCSIHIQPWNKCIKHPSIPPLQLLSKTI